MPWSGGLCWRITWLHAFGLSLLLAGTADASRATPVRDWGSSAIAPAARPIGSLSWLPGGPADVRSARWRTVFHAVRVATDDGLGDLDREAAPFSGGRRQFGPFVVQGFGGPPFPWMPMDGLCTRASSCNSGSFGDVLSLRPGIGWTGGGGPVIPLFRREGETAIALDASLAPTLVGYFSGPNREAPPLTGGGRLGLSVAVDDAGGASLRASAALLVFGSSVTRAAESQLFVGVALGWR